MKCEVISDLLPLFDDPELTEEERSMIDSHVASCVRCAQELASIRSAQSQLRVLRNTPVPAAGPDRILRATRKLPASPLRRTWRYILQGYPLPAGGFLAGAVALLLLVVVPMLRPYTPVPMDQPMTLMSAPQEDAPAVGARSFAYEMRVVERAATITLYTPHPSVVAERIAQLSQQVGQPGVPAVTELADGSIEMTMGEVTPDWLDGVLTLIQEEFDAQVVVSNPGSDLDLETTPIPTVIVVYRQPEQE